MNADRDSYNASDGDGRQYSLVFNPRRLEDYSVSNWGLRSGPVGTPEHVRERVEAFEAAGPWTSCSCSAACVARAAALRGVHATIGQ